MTEFMTAFALRQRLCGLGETESVLDVLAMSTRTLIPFLGRPPQTPPEV